VVAAEKEDAEEENLEEEVHIINNNIYKSSSGHPVYQRDQLAAEDRITGPAIILDPYASTFLEEGWSCHRDGQGTLVLQKLDRPSKTEAEGIDSQMSQEAELELFSRRFMGIAENMGAMLQHASLSVNVKERLDFSCAIVDAEGYLVANAPHIPVHLGSLGICVRRILNEFEVNPGDTIITNHPAYGGSHLPDITLVSPVYTEEGHRIGFVVNRAHHAEIGGISPGSMPPDARSLAEEGVVIKPFYLARRGEVDWKGIEEILAGAPYPTRNLAENLADLNGALAANIRGVNELKALATTHGAGRVSEFMGRLKNYARELTLETISGYPLKQAHALELLDDGSPLEVRLKKTGSGYLIDFTGSAPVHPGNLNANPAIVHSVIMYVLRLLLDRDLPLNDGLLEAVEVVLPEGLLNPPFPEDPFQCPALVGGNVEVSQRLTDTLLKALQLQAASQGTMNNVLFGNESFGYYETICGGCGAGPAFQGADAVHHHMTNTRITDPEIMEHRYPVRLECFKIRRGSGGKGQNKGGDGVIRRLHFLEPVQLSVLTQRRTRGPYGMAGGGEGHPGQQWIIRKDGTRETLSSVSATALQPGDTFVIKTPGGGGWGAEN
jgi:5-oxoprolinase (ATP-hydrolysing)